MPSIRQWLRNDFTKTEERTIIAWIGIIYGSLFFLVSLIGFHFGHPHAFKVLVLGILGQGFGIETLQREKEKKNLGGSL